MQRIKEIKQLLRQYDYVPIARKVGDGLMLVMPHPALASPGIKPVTEAYVIRRGVDSGYFYNSSIDPTERFVSVPEYAIRLVLLSRILKHCERVPISHELVCYFDEENGEHPYLDDVVSSPLIEEERAKEGFLATLVAEARREDFSSKLEEVALTHGVYEGYQLVQFNLGVHRT
jgi:hypothetical protein